MSYSQLQGYQKPVKGGSLVWPPMYSMKEITTISFVEMLIWRYYSV